MSDLPQPQPAALAVLLWCGARSDQLLLMRNEDYARAQRPHMEAVFRFLNIREPTPAEWDNIMAMKTRNKNSDK